MRKITLLNLLLLPVIALLLFLVIREPGIEKPAGTPSLPVVERAEVERISIQQRGVEAVALEKSGGEQWDLIRPLRIAAAKSAIDSLLRITTIKSLNRFPVATDKLEKFGLAKPRAELLLNDSVRIFFGGATPLDRSRYIRINGEIHLIHDAFYYLMTSPWTTFVSRRLLPENSTIHALQLPTLELRWHNDRWQVEPEVTAADRITILLDAWKFASALRVEEYNHAPGTAVSIWVKGVAEPLQLLLTAHEPDLVLARPDLGIQYHFPAAAADQMLTIGEPNENTESKPDDT